MKRITLVLAAVAAVAFTVPAMASAAEWTVNGAPLSKAEPVELDGKFEMSILGSVVSCPVHMGGSLSPGNKGEITTFDVDGTAEKPCTSSGTFANCVITGTGFNLAMELTSKTQIVFTGTGLFPKSLWSWTFTQKSGTEGKCSYAGKSITAQGPRTTTVEQPSGWWSSQDFTGSTLFKRSDGVELTTGVSGKLAVKTPNGLVVIK